MKRDSVDGVIKLHEAGRPVPKGEIVVKVNFPAIREGDLGILVDATVKAMTLNNRAGQIIGMDEKEGIRRLYDLLDFENGDELIEEQYPDSEYERDRSKEELPAPIMRPPVGFPAGTPADDVQVGEALKAALARLQKATKAYESRRNGHAALPRI
jgi:hypothetical protein